MDLGAAKKSPANQPGSKIDFVQVFNFVQVFDLDQCRPITKNHDCDPSIRHPRQTAARERR
jgi:hypothetical protein